MDKLKMAIPAKSEELKDGEGAKAATETPEVKETAPEKPEDTQETKAVVTVTPESEVKETAPVSTNGIRHYVEYMGGGVWSDKNGVKWSNIDGVGFINNMQFTDEEYNAREDIIFMVVYGSMKHTVIE